ncbi:hypothetical protein LLG95_01925 [bacterium]|nr:hypothetical protein [bacterium]
MHQGKLKIIENIVIAAAFVALIGAPLALEMINIRPGPELVENRRLAEAPRLDAGLADFPKAFEPYFNDHFRLRNPLIVMEKYVTARVLNMSPSSKVIIGKGDWLFSGEGDAIKNFTGDPPLTQDEMYAWAKVIQERCRWFKARGIHYMMVVVPEKQTIYPEFMPDNIKPCAPSQSRLENLINYLRANTQADIIHLRPALMDAKTSHQLYLYRDTHWNYEGAYVAYEQIVTMLSNQFPGLAPIPRAKFKMMPNTINDGDLVNLMGLTGIYSENWEKLEVAEPRARVVDASQYDLASITQERYQAHATEIDDPKLPKAVMYRDSFSTILMPMLSEHFRRIVYIWNANYKAEWGCDFDPTIIAKEKPDVFIEEFVERKIGDIPTNWTIREMK